MNHIVGYSHYILTPCNDIYVSISLQAIEEHKTCRNVDSRAPNDESIATCLPKFNCLKTS